MVPSSAALTCTTRAPRASCACQIWPIVGNSQSVRTTFDRCVKRRPLASALTPAESEAVTAISSAPALTSPAKAPRAASCRSTQYSHGAPLSSQSSRYCSYAPRTASDNAPCEHELMYTCRSKIGNRCRHRAASDAASTAKVGLPQVLVCKQVLCGTLQHQSPGGENVAAVRDRKRHVRILLDDEHRDAGLMHLLDDLEASLDEDRRQPHRRLVHEEQLRARHQRATHGDHLLLSSGECPRELRPSLVEQREECVDALEVFLPPPRIANEVRAHLEVLEHRHRSEEPAVLRDDRHSLLDPIARRAAGHLFAAELDGAVAGLHKSEDRLERRGLSRSVPAKERHELAFAHVQVQTLEDVDLSVVRVDVPQPEEIRDTVRAHFVSALRRPR